MLESSAFGILLGKKMGDLMYLETNQCPEEQIDHVF